MGVYASHYVLRNTAFGRRRFRVVRYGGGAALAVEEYLPKSLYGEEDGGQWVVVFFVQDEEAVEWSDMWDEKGTKALLDYLDLAGVRL